jgi:signal transduction histidine kinase
MVSEIENLVSAQVEDSDESRTAVVDISEATEKVLLNFEVAIKQKGISLNYDKLPCEARIVPDEFDKIAVNLVSNAVKYTDRGGEISVRTFRRDDGRAVFSIKDSGIGIAKEDLPNIFDYLYRADESRTRDSGGNGIGLSVVKTIVEAHKGTIEVESAPGRGSVFTVAIPGA